MTDRLTDSQLAEIKDRLPLSTLVGQYVVWDKAKSTPSRGDMWACCPLHGESSPSFHVRDAEQQFKCFGCGEAGDHFDFLVKSQGMAFTDAVRAAAELAGVRLPEKSPYPSQDGRSAPPPHNAPPAEEQPPAPPQEGRRVQVAAFDYCDRDGNPIYQVTRWQIQMPDGSYQRTKDGNGTWKTFLQRRPTGLPDGSWAWGLSAGEYMRPGPGKDWSAFNEERFARWPHGECRWLDSSVEHTIYRHQQVDLAIAEGTTIHLVEGEKDVETLEGWGLVATTNSGGASHWTDAMAQHLRGADVVILPDNDDAGRAGAEKKALSLRGVAKRVRVLDLARHVPGFPAKGDVTDWRDKLGGDASKLGQILNTQPDWAPAPPKSKFGARRGRDIAGSKIVYDWLVKGLIERGGVFIVAGEKQAGKSFFVLDLGMKIALGLEYGKGDKARKVKQGAVIYLACEDRKGVDMRYEGWRRDNDVPADQDVPFVIMGGGEGQKFSLLNDDSVDAFIAECLEWKAFYGSLEMIVVDTFSVATEGLDEIHSGEVGKVLGRVNRIAEKTGASVCLVHHMNGEGNRVRGHSSLTANVSQVIEIRNLVRPQPNRRLPPELIKDADNRIIRQAILEKNKNGPNRIAWRFVLRQVKLGLDDDGYEISTCVMDTPSSEPDEGQVKTGRLSAPQKLTYDALQAAIEDRGTPIPNGVRAGSSVRLCVEHRHFIDQVRKVMEFRASDTETEARNKELSDFMARNVMALMNGGYMGRDNDLKIVWLTGKEDRAKPDPKPADKPPPLPPDVKEALDAGVPF